MPQPLYRQVYDTVLARITGGDLRAGAMLPNEFDLGAEMGVSQGTARKALIELERAGVVERRQGRGTFVTTTTEDRALFHFFRLRHPDGTPAIPEPLSESVIRRRARAEDRPLDSAHVFEITRIRAIEGRPAMHERIVVPAELFPGLPDRTPLSNALYVLYEGAYGIRIARADETLRAVTAAEGDPLASPGSALLEVQRKAHALTGRLVEMRWSRYDTARTGYAVTLT
ncbi:MAG: GntR family transcriptional regulator [Pseudomonadota bacterium]